MAAPYDLNVTCLSDGNYPEEYILKAIAYGYRNFAVNHELSEGLLSKKKGKDKSVTINQAKPSHEFLSRLHDEIGEGQVNLYTRVTVELNQNSELLRTMKSQLDSYDILAVRPADMKAVERLPEMDIDIVTFDPTVRYQLKRGLIKGLMKKGVTFEINYAPCIVDQTMRVSIIQLAQDLLVNTKGKNIVLSSGDNRIHNLRSPYDVINLAVLFGMTHDVAKDVIMSHSRLAIKHSESRKSFKTCIDISKVSDGVEGKRKTDNGDSLSKKKKKKKV